MRCPDPRWPPRPARRTPDRLRAATPAVHRRQQRLITLRRPSVVRPLQRPEPGQETLPEASFQAVDQDLVAIVPGQAEIARQFLSAQHRHLWGARDVGAAARGCPRRSPAPGAHRPRSALAPAPAGTRSTASIPRGRWPRPPAPQRLNSGGLSGLPHWLSVWRRCCHCCCQRAGVLTRRSPHVPAR